MAPPCPTCGPEFLQWLQADASRLSAWQGLPRRGLGRGQLLQAQGQPLVAVWFVEHGLLRSHVLGHDGRERNCAFHPEGQWAGTPAPQGMAAVAEQAIDALEPSRVVELRHAELAAWLHAGPELLHKLNDALAANLMVLSRRESSLLLDDAEQRYHRFLAEQPEIARRLPLHHVASYLGITNVALSRVRRRLRERQPAPARRPAARSR